MPHKLPTACRCGRRNCEKHRRTDYRPAAHKRGYDAQWRKVRALKLNQDPLCELYCKDEGRTTAAQDVHHVKPIATHPELRLDLTNLRSACRPCHNRLEKGARP